MSQDAKFQTSSIKMYCLMPTYDADAATAAGLSPEQIRKRKMEVLQACIAVFVRDINQYSSQGQEVEILCPDGKVYKMTILLVCLALDHEATEKHCLKAANGCLSCACSQDDFADATGRAFSPMMVEDVIRRIEEASAEYLDRDGNILEGKIGAVERWEHEHKIKLHWNNWFDVSPPSRHLFAFLFPESDCREWRDCAVASSRRAISAIFLDQLVFHACCHNRALWQPYCEGSGLQNQSDAAQRLVHQRKV
jgi:hypothetical protein